MGFVMRSVPIEIDIPQQKLFLIGASLKLNPLGFAYLGVGTITTNYLEFRLRQINSAIAKAEKEEHSEKK
jgi:hypothetical protein